MEYYHEYYFEVFFVCTHASLKLETKIEGIEAMLFQKNFWATKTLGLCSSELQFYFEKVLKSSLLITRSSHILSACSLTTQNIF